MITQSPSRAASRHDLIIPLFCGLLILAVLYFVRSKETSSEPITKEMVTTETRLATIRKLIYQFKQRTGVLPPSAQVLQSVVPTANAAVYVDGWGQPFRFLTNSSGSLMVYSLGADLQAGGVGTNVDIVLNIDL
jgi:hypothetical protein